MRSIPKLIVACTAAMTLCSAQAHRYFTVDECVEFSQFVWLIAKARDNGATAERVAEAAANSIYAASFIQDQLDEQMAMSSIVIVYQLGDQPAEDLKDQVLESCIRLMVKHSATL